MSQGSLGCCVFRSPGALTFGYECLIHVGVDVGAGDAEINVIYITFIISAQYTGYSVLYKYKVQVDNWATEVTCVQIRFHNRFICVEFVISIYVLSTGGYI